MTRKINPAARHRIDRLMHGVILIIVSTLFSCNNIPNDVSTNLKAAGANRSELEKVLEQYKNDEEKLNAAYFLIGNMDIHQSNTGDYSDYHQIYPIVNQLTNMGYKKKELYGLVMDSLNEIQNKYGPIQNVPFEMVPDLQNVKADFLIKNIDLAFEVWKTKPWCKDVNFETFCQYILPYRIHDEPLCEFRSYFMNEFKWLEDSLHDATDAKEVCLLINNYISRKYTFVENMGIIPFPNAIDMYKFGAGECEHRYFLAISIMRSLGIPVTIDQSLQWNHWPGKHSWVTLIGNNYIVPFNAGEPYVELPEDTSIPIGMKTSSTVFRQHFNKNQDSPIFSEQSIYNVPENMRRPNLENVTADYQFTMSSLKLDLDDKMYDKTIYLGCFGRGKEIVAVDFLLPGQKEFKNIGRCGIYVPFHFKNNKMEFLSMPFILSCEGNEKWYSQPLLDKMDTLILTRKYGLNDSMTKFSEDMIGGYFQGSNSLSFNPADTLFTITEPPIDFKEVIVNAEKKYKYLRFVAPAGHRTNIAEIEFYCGETKLTGAPISNRAINIESAFDNDIKTNFSADTNSWVGLTMTSFQNISKIRFLIRNDQNIVEKDNFYELFYFENGWKSLGIQKSTSNKLTFIAPRYSLLLLRNITQGTEERIFKYENGRQIFW